MSLLEKHIMEGSDGSLIFVFDMEKAFEVDSEGRFSLKNDAEVLDFGALMVDMNIELCEEGALALVEALLEKRAAGELEDFA